MWRGVNGLDLALIALIGLAAVAGFRRGAVLQLLSYGGLFLGLVVGALLGPPIASLADSHAAQASIAVTVLLVGAGVGNALGWVAGGSLRAHAHGTRLRAADAAGGIVVSVAATLLAIWFVALNLVNGPFPRLASEVRGSAIVRTLGGALPEPPSLLAEVRRFFDRFGFPEVFSGLPPSPSGPVEWPTQAEAQQAFDAAARSTVRVVGAACGEINLGSGFVVNDHYVATAAHVIAGVGSPQVQDRSGASQPATPVVYDPGMDVAVLYVPGALGPPLALIGYELDRGAVGAVLGYPRGGVLEGDRAAVRRPIDALGRDIYGTRDVERQVYELQTTVAPGDSGGPFVLSDGTVAGMVFAASTVDAGVGYAVTSTDMLPSVRGGFGLVTPVPTGPCVR